MRILTNVMIVLMAKRQRSIFKDYKFIALLLLVIGIIFTGMLFYNRIEHWSLLDSIYFSIVTLTTVGFGDFSPHTDAGKVFTIFYLLIGVGVLLALIALIADHTINNYHRLAEPYFKSKNSKK